MPSYWSTHPGTALYDLERHVTSLRPVQERTDFNFVKRCEPRHSSMNRRCRPEDSSSTTNIIERRGCTPTTTATLTKNASAVLEIRSNPPSIPMPTTTSTNGSSAIYIDCALFCFVCVEKSHCRAQCPLIPNHHREKSGTQHYKTWRTCPESGRKSSDISPQVQQAEKHKILS